MFRQMDHKPILVTSRSGHSGFGRGSNSMRRIQLDVLYFQFVGKLGRTMGHKATIQQKSRAAFRSSDLAQHLETSQSE